MHLRINAFTYTCSYVHILRSIYNSNTEFVNSPCVLILIVKELQQLIPLRAPVQRVVNQDAVVTVGGRVLAAQPHVELHIDCLTKVKVAAYQVSVTGLNEQEGKYEESFLN